MNRNKRLGSAAAIAMAAVLLSAPAHAWMSKEEKARVDQLENRVVDLEQRLKRAERLIESGNLQKMFMKQERQEETTRNLQGQIEELQHKLQQMDRHQREIFLDFDQRLQQRQSMPSGSDQSTPDDMTSEAGESGGVTGAAPEFDEAAQYKAAFDYLKSRNFPAAIDGFQTFLKTWPGSTLAGNAQYWLGEAHYGNRDYESAVREFEKVRSLYPESRKVPDASLKLGYSYYALKQWSKARKVLQALRQAYPDTPVAGLAAERLKRMKLEGH